MYDAVMQQLATAQQKSAVLRDLSLEPKRYFLATVHRAENTNDPERLAGILRALDELAKASIIIWPVHPRTRHRMEELGLKATSAGLRLVEPVPYLDMLLLTSNAALVLTDSGGLQKEAMWLRARCVTMRDETEWVETVESGWNYLAGADSNRIVSAAQEMLNKADLKAAGEENAGASSRMVQLLADRYAR
jgi:UDP-N-acetylglucosamine 2-epimerase